MNDSDTLKEKIRALGVAKVAKQAGLSPTTLYSFLDRDNAHLRADTQAKVIAAIKGMESGTGAEMTLAGDQYLPIPVFDISASAGPGSLVEDGEPIAYQVFRAQWLYNLGVKTDMLAVIQVRGDSMADTIQHGDTVLVNRAINRVVEEGIYILSFDGGLLIKRCQRNPLTGALSIISDNKAYETYTATAEQVPDLHILGRIVWIGRQVA